jgi:hypothetical protein
MKIGMTSLSGAEGQGREGKQDCAISEYSSGTRISAAALAAAAVLAFATPSFAQSASETPSSAQPAPAKAHSSVAKKKKKPAPTPDPAPSAAATPARSAGSGNSQATDAQNPLTPVYSILNQNDTNFGVGPLRGTQNALLVEPIIPIKLTPDFNLVTRWITPVIREPALAPSIGSEFGLGNMEPQFFFTPAHTGNGFVWALGPALWLPTATDKTLGVNRFGGGPTGVALEIQGPLLYGVLANNVWAGSHGSSATGQRINQLLIEPFVFYTLPTGGWYLCSLPMITSDWTVPDHKWTVPIGGGFGRVIPVGDLVMNANLQAFYNGTFGHSPGITNAGNWTLELQLQFIRPGAKVPALF